MSVLQESKAGSGVNGSVGLVKVVVPDDRGNERAFRKAVGRRLRMARVMLDTSQQEVAEAAGCSRNFVSAIERGVQGPDAYRLGLIATALRMPLSTLLEGDGWQSWMDGTRLDPDAGPATGPGLR
jgi:DNA-binding XRE family transcriptional regulator